MARSRLASLVRAARPLAHGNIAPPIVYGQALAYAATGHFSWWGLAIAQGFGVIDHLVIVLANDYADREADALNASPTPFSGGSRVLPDGELAPSTIGMLAIGACVALVAFSMAASGIAPVLPWLAASALGLIWAYSYPPLRLSYRGGGELLQGIGVGVVLPLVGVVAQGAPIDARTMTCLLPSFVLGVAGNVLTSIPDGEADRAAGKGSPAARWGVRRARRVSIALHGIAVVVALAFLPLVGAAVAIALVLVLQFFAARLPHDDARRTAITFVVLGGASETLAVLAWSVGLVFR